MSVRFGSVWYEQRWIQFVFVLFSQFIRSSRMLGKLYVPGKKCAEFALHNITPNHTEHEPNTNRTLGATVRFGSCSPGYEPDFCSVRPMFGSVRFGSPNVRRAHSGPSQRLRLPPRWRVPHYLPLSLTAEPKTSNYT